jgi:hypothetical protein
MTADQLTAEKIVATPLNPAKPTKKQMRARARQAIEKRVGTASASITPAKAPAAAKNPDDVAAKKAAAKKNATARLVVIAGPYKGEEYVLGKGYSAKILFGSKPSTKAKNVEMISLPLDTNMDASHALLEFVGNKKCLVINVKNVSKGRTLINVNPVKKECAGFLGYTITIGDTVMRVDSI